MSSRTSGLRASHRQPIPEQISPARVESARHSARDAYHPTRHDSGARDVHTQSSVSVQHRAVEPVSDEAAQLAELAGSWFDRFEDSHALDDLHRAIDLQERAFQLMHENHPKRLYLRDDLSISLWHRFNHLGQMNDLERSITLRQQAVARTPQDDSNYVLRLSDLATSLGSRYQHLGELHDLRDSIAKKKEALHLTPENHPDRPRRLSNLGMALRLLFERLGDVQDLEEAIVTHRLAVDLTPEGHPDRPWRLDGLAGSLRLRFKRIGEIRDLEEAIAAGRESVKLTPEGHPQHPLRLSNLADRLRSRFERHLNISDLESAIATQKHAIKLTPEDHPERPRRLGMLSSALRLRYQHLGEPRDLEDAIATLRLVLDLMPEGHPERSIALFNFGLSLKAQFECEKSKARFDAVYECFQKATLQPLGNPATRLATARECVSLLTNHPEFTSAEMVLNAHSQIIQIFPEVAWIGHSIERRYEESARLGTEMNAAVSAFIRLQSRYQAIEWMEGGRSLVWSQVFTLREPLEALDKVYPELASKLRDVSLALQQSGSWSEPVQQPLQHLNVSGSSGTTLAETNQGAVANFGNDAFRSGADHHRDLAIQYEAILKDIRRQPGFEGFLRPPKLSSLLPSIGCLDGPVVFINVHSSSCDALALSPNGAIRHIPLPDLTESGALNLRSTWAQFIGSSHARTRGVVAAERLLAPHRNTNTFGSVLWKLWTWIVRPILQALGLVHDHPSTLPHVTWCPTGPVTQLPLHAAGIYDFSDTSRSQRVFDYVISSYTPSLAALLRSREAIRANSDQPDEVLVIAQPATPEYAPLPCTREEHIRVGAVLQGSSLTVLNDKDATNAAVVAAMEGSTWVHLACHGYQDSRNPTRSAFALYDGPLTLFKLMGTSAEKSELAFLSACQTAVGDAKIPEESAHLAAGMLAVGFKGVIATMWSIRDDDAPVIVQSYYKELLEIRRAGRVAEGYTGAAYALHVATAMLRRQVGEENFARWAPFVHFGV